MFTLFMSGMFATLWAGMCWLPAFAATARPDKGLGPEHRLAIWAVLFLATMAIALYRNRARARQGEVEPWKDAARRDHDFQDGMRRRRRHGLGAEVGGVLLAPQRDEAEGGALLLYFLMMIPQLAVDSFFEFLYSLSDHDDEGYTEDPFADEG